MSICSRTVRSNKNYEMTLDNMGIQNYQYGMELQGPPRMRRRQSLTLMTPAQLKLQPCCRSKGLPKGWISRPCQANRGIRRSNSTGPLPVPKIIENSYGSSPYNHEDAPGAMELMTYEVGLMVRSVRTTASRTFSDVDSRDRSCSVLRTLLHHSDVAHEEWRSSVLKFGVTSDINSG
jgi:hypothetical protein